MAHPRLRSMNTDLHIGATEGGYKQSAPNRGGVVESSYFTLRRDMDPVWHGFGEKNPKYAPGVCETVTTPDAMPWVTPDSTKW